MFFVLLFVFLLFVFSLFVFLLFVFLVFVFLLVVFLLRLNLSLPAGRGSSFPEVWLGMYYSINNPVENLILQKHGLHKLLVQELFC